MKFNRLEIMKKQYAKKVGLGILALIPAFVSAGGVSVARADEYAAKERSNAAIGHYARARAMLVEALAEFEQGRKYARPDMLLDPEEWRLSLVSRTEELNRILDPRPRVSREGVRFSANPMLIRREKDRLPPAADGAHTTNTFGEEVRKKDMKAARARLDELQAEIEAKEQAGGEDAMGADEALEDTAPKAAKSTKAKAKDKSLDEAINSLSSIPATDTSVKIDKTATAKKVETPAKAPVVEAEEEEVATPPGSAEETLFGPSKEQAPAKAEEKAAPAAKLTEKKPTSGKPVPLTEKQEDQVSKAIDDAIQERVKTIQSSAPKSDDPESDDAAE